MTTKTRNGRRNDGVGRLLTDTLRTRWDTFAALLRSVRRKARAREVHDLRVALRRLIAMLDLLRQLLSAPELEDLRKRLRRPLRKLGELRDVQVQMEMVEGLVTAHTAMKPFLRSLKQREKKLSGKARDYLADVPRKKLQRRFEEVARTVDLQLLTHTRQERHRNVAAEAVDRAFAAVVEARGQLDATELETVHRMRVAFKKFRYKVEVLSPQLPGVGTAQLQSMHAFQQMMGEVHDIDVLLQRLTSWFERHPKQRLLAVQDELSQRLMLATDTFLAAADEVFVFWRQAPA